MDLAAALIAVEENAELLRGPKGERGVPGRNGAPGKNGARGPIGEQGPAGESIIGPAGQDGRDGKDGARGPTGVRGPTGPKGETGAAGKNGQDGVGPDEKVRISRDDPKAGFLADKLTAGTGIEIRTETDKRGERLVIDARRQLSSGGGGGQAGILVYDDGVGVGFGDSVSFDGGDPVTISGGIIRVPVGSGAAAAGPVYRGADPGAVGAGAVWLEDAGSGWRWQVRNAADDGWVTIAYAGQGPDGTVYFNPHVHVPSGKAETWISSRVGGDGTAFAATNAWVDGDGQATSSLDAFVAGDGDAIVSTDATVIGDGDAFNNNTADQRGDGDATANNYALKAGGTGIAKSEIKAGYAAEEAYFHAEADATSARASIHDGVSTGALADVPIAQGDGTFLWGPQSGLPGSPETYTETNVVTDRAFDASASTLDEVLHVLGSLISDLRARGVVA